MTAVDTTGLSAAEADLLASAEKVIDRGLTTFIEVGDALATVRDNRLYRTTFPTFEAYCQQRWGFSDSRARQLIGAAQTVTNVTALGLPAPATESQARALNAVPADERADVWADTLERTAGKPTAAAVAETIKHRPLWKCGGCGEVNARAKAPKNCPTCQCPAFDDVVEALAAELSDPTRQWVYIRYRSTGQEHHQVFPKGDVTFCRKVTIGGHILPVGVLVEKYGSTPCGSCWPPAAPAEADRRWECRECAHTFTAPVDVLELVTDPPTARCPRCEKWQTTDLGPAEPDDVDDLGDEIDTHSHCTSCGHVEKLAMLPPWCYRCAAAPAQIKTGVVPDDAGHDVVDGRCLTCAPWDHPGERVYTAWMRDGAAYHRLNAAGKETICGARTSETGHILTRRNLLRGAAAEPCKYGCWPAPAPAAAVDEADAFDGVHRGHRSWGSGPNGAGMRCTCGTVLEGYATVADASMLMDRHVAEANAEASAAADEVDDERAETKHCEKCGTPLGEEPALMGYLRCDECDSEGDHVSIDGGPCLVCAPDDHAAEKVWMAADRYGLAYHGLDPQQTGTRCDRSINSGRVMTRGEAFREIGGKPCRKCWPDGDAPPAAPAEPVLEGEVVAAGPEPAAPAAPVVDPDGHFARLVAVCRAFTDAVDETFLPDALSGFDAKHAHHIAYAVHVAGWLSELLDNAKAAAAPAAGQVPGQLDILTEGVPDGADR